MAITVTMPQLGESVTEGTIAKWLKQPGEPVAKDESIAEVITDKVNAEIPSPEAGSIATHIASEGTVVSVGDPICTIETASSVGQDGDGDGAGGPVPSRQAHVSAPAPAPAAASPAPMVSASSAAVPAAAIPEGMHLTPAVRMLLRERNLDVRAVTGTGIGGRVTKKDVLEHSERGEVPTTALSNGPAPTVEAVPAPRQVDLLVPLTPARRAVADHMVRSKQTSPHAWMMVEVDMTRISRLRAASKAEFKQRHGVNLTFLPFAAVATVEALQRFPTFNSVWTDQGITLRHQINLGIAVALEDSLIVPVVGNAERLSLAGLAQTMVDLGVRARANRLKLDEIQGGTFTLNNTGSLGTVLTQAIINQPQAAILAMDAIVKRPVVIEDDAIAIRSMMNISLSFDHRINDGLQAARFLGAIKEILEGMGDAAVL